MIVNATQNFIPAYVHLLTACVEWRNWWYFYRSIWDRIFTV